MRVFSQERLGGLRYEPWSTFKLPEVVQVYSKTPTAAQCSPEEGPTVTEWGEEPVEVPICKKSGHVTKTRRLYRLHWPGQLHEDRAPEPDWDVIPEAFLRDLQLCRCGRGNDTNGDGDCPICARSTLPAAPSFYSLRGCMRAGWRPPAKLPPAVAYHLAVNGGRYYARAVVEDGERPTLDQLEEVLQGSVRHPVGPLPTSRVAQVLDARFALDTHAMAALDHLRWQAESWFHNPHIMGFDTIIREGLYRACWTFVQLYFWLLGDYIYDQEKHYWSREDSKYHWWQLAGCLFWTGRTGGGVVTELAGAFSREAPRVANFSKRHPDVLERMKEWPGRVELVDEEADSSS